MTLTKTDLSQIKEVLKEGLNEQEKRFDYKLEETKVDVIDKIDNKLQNFKSEFFKKIDPILKEVITAREERPLIENRIEALENIHPKGKHVLSP